MKISTTDSAREINCIQQKEIDFKVARHATDKKVKILRVIKAQG